MKKYKVIIREISEKEIEVDANSKREAEDIAEKRYKDCEVILYPEDHVNTMFIVKNKERNKQYDER